MGIDRTHQFGASSRSTNTTPLGAWGTIHTTKQCQSGRHSKLKTCGVQNSYEHSGVGRTRLVFQHIQESAVQSAAGRIEFFDYKPADLSIIADVKRVRAVPSIASGNQRWMAQDIRHTGWGRYCAVLQTLHQAL